MFFFLGGMGASMLFEVNMREPQVHLVTDASGLWGCAAYWNGEWFQIAWSEYPEFGEAPIAAMEMLPVLVAAAL